MQQSFLALKIAQFIPSIMKKENNDNIRVTLRSRDGAVVRTLAPHQCVPGSIPVWCHMCVEFCCWCSPYSEGFSTGSPLFLPAQKPTSPNSNSTGIEDPRENQVRLM